jgi:hypothetical protein
VVGRDISPWGSTRFNIASSPAISTEGSAGLRLFLDHRPRWPALISGEGVAALLGTQGDQWDNKWEMFMALLGAATALALQSRLQDRQITTLQERSHV